MANHTVDQPAANNITQVSEHSFEQMSQADAIDALTAKAGQLAAMLCLTHGENGAGLSNLNADIRDSFMWACSSVADDVHGLAVSVARSPAFNQAEPQIGSEGQRGFSEGQEPREFRGAYDGFHVPGGGNHLPAALLVNSEAGPLTLLGAALARFKFMQDQLRAWACIGDIGEASIEDIIGPIEAQAGDINNLLEAVNDSLFAAGVRK